MGRTIVLHLGAQKTASSALQAALVQNSRMLFGHGVAIMARPTVLQTMIDAERSEVRELMERVNAGTVIVTHEVLLGWPFGPPREMMPKYPYLYPEAR